MATIQKREIIFPGHLFVFSGELFFEIEIEIELNTIYSTKEYIWGINKFEAYMAYMDHGARSLHAQLLVVRRACRSAGENVTASLQSTNISSVIYHRWKHLHATSNYVLVSGTINKLSKN